MNTKANLKSVPRLDNKEINGLFCEDVLRQWLHNLEEQVRKRDDSEQRMRTGTARP